MVGEMNLMTRGMLSLVLPSLLIVSPAVYVLVSGGGPNFVAEMLMGKTLALLALVVVTWLVLNYITPRIEPPSRAAKSMLIGSVLSFAFFMTSGALWLETAELNVLGKNARVMTQGDLKTQWERPWGERSRGIFVQAKVKPHQKDEEAEVVAYYTASRVQANQSYFPTSFEVVLDDGYRTEVACVQSRARAVNWPQTKNGKIGLSQGDTIVVWGEPSQYTAMGNGLAIYGVAESKAIISGSFETLEESFLKPVQAAARPVGWMALGVLLLSWLPLLLSYWIGKDGPLTSAPQAP